MAEDRRSTPRSHARCAKTRKQFTFHDTALESHPWRPIATSTVFHSRVHVSERHEVCVPPRHVLQRSLKRNLLNPILQKYARKTAKKLGKRNFVASNGWLESFRRNHNLNFKKISGSEGSQNFLTPEELISAWSEKLATLITGYGEKDIAVSKKTGLDYHTVPGKLLSLKKEWFYKN